MTTPGPFDMRGKLAFITGGGTGLGRQFALTLAGAGASVVLGARRTEPLLATAEAVRAAGGEAYCVAVDVADAGSVEKAFEAIARIGALDVVVNNAGLAGADSLLDATDETWDRLMDVNVKGAWHVARAGVRQMIAAGKGGSIVNVASVLGTAVQKGTANYPASKAALLHLTRAMAVEWARYGVRVNALAPGYFRTEMSDEFLSSERGKAMVSRQPIRRLGEPAELGGALLLLASDASTYMTGSVIAVDGGLSIPLVG
jgi:NAD(P)-dependent dehydrogenase (short-subunit alcohol dehydrogenase family)